MKTLEEMRKRIEEIVAKLDVFSTTEIKDEDLVVINELNEEFNSLKGTIEAREKIENMKAATSAPQRQVAPKATPRVEVKASRLEENMGFKNLGEFAVAIVNKSRGNLDRRFQNDFAYEKFSEDGGILIPEDFKSTIDKKITQSDDSLMAKCDVMPVTGNSMSVPIDSEQPWAGGIDCYWTAEGSSITESKAALKSASYRLHKLASLVKVTDELLEDAAAIESHIKTKAPAAIMHKINDAIINGNGVGKPSGILNTGFKIAVAKEAAQTADTIVYKNIIKAEARLLPSANAIWIAHPKCKEQLRQLKDDNGNAIYMNGGAFPNIATAGFDTLLGRPIVYMIGSVPNLGDEGDLTLVDLSYYKMIVKSGIKQDISTHLLFDQAATAFRFIQRLDGSCPYTAPVTTQYGSYTMSGIVTIAERA